MISIPGSLNSIRDVLCESDYGKCLTVHSFLLFWKSQSQSMLEVPFVYSLLNWRVIVLIMVWYFHNYPLYSSHRPTAVPLLGSWGGEGSTRARHSHRVRAGVSHAQQVTRHHHALSNLVRLQHTVLSECHRAATFRPVHATWPQIPRGWSTQWALSIPYRHWQAGQSQKCPPWPAAHLRWAGEILHRSAEKGRYQFLGTGC